MYNLQHKDSVATINSEDLSLTVTTEYQEWYQMIEKCYNQDHPLYQKYGTLGVTVSEPWIYSFANFLHDLGDIPKDGNYYFLARIDHTKPYQNDNCIWQKAPINRLRFQACTATTTKEEFNMKSYKKNPIPPTPPTIVYPTTGNGYNKFLALYELLQKVNNSSSNVINTSPNVNAPSSRKADLSLVQHSKHCKCCTIS